MSNTLNCYILEGTWWNYREVPQVLPYFQALAMTHPHLRVSHRSIRTASDIEFWVKKIRKGERAFLYFACHGYKLDLYPIGERHPIRNAELLEALGAAKPYSIDYIHFGCCQMIRRMRKDESLTSYLNATGAIWASGYSKMVDWFQGTLLDLALISELAIPMHLDSKDRYVKPSYRGKRFTTDYNLQSKRLGFAGGYINSDGQLRIFPE
jgi:hypothetical protein